MTIRTTMIILGLAALTGGCTITTRHDEVRDYQHDRRVIREADSYEGYYYVRIIYLNGIPWYVDEDLRARPVPPHLRSHFRYASWSRSLPPSFSRDTGLRDGYRLSRIVYINEVPHHVDEGRHVRPLPSGLRSRFSYGSVARHDDYGRRPGERSEPPIYRNETRPLPPAYGRERQDPPDLGALGRVTERVREEPLSPAHGRERQEPPAYGADNAPGRGMPPGRVREGTRPLPPAYGRERQDSPDLGALGRVTERVREEPLPPAHGRERQEPHAYGADNAPGRGMPPGRVREEPLPPAHGRERQEPHAYEAANAPGRGMPPERMREETGRQVPPFARNVRTMPPQQNEDLPSVRGPGIDERRSLPQDEGRDGDNVQRGRGQSAGNGGQRRMDAIDGHERNADPEPERKNGKGKGRMKDQEADSPDERDGDAGNRKRRDE